MPKLGGLHHSKTRQLPPEKPERKKYVLPIRKKVKKEGNSNRKLVDDRLFINGNLQNQYLQSFLPLEVAVDVSGINVKESDPIEEGNNTIIRQTYRW